MFVVEDAPFLIPFGHEKFLLRQEPSAPTKRFGCESAGLNEAKNTRRTPHAGRYPFRDGGWHAPIGIYNSLKISVKSFSCLSRDFE
jgi:hypothetical protein